VGKNHLLRNFIICIFGQKLVDEVKQDEMSKAHNMEEFRNVCVKTD